MAIDENPQTVVFVVPTQKTIKQQATAPFSLSF